MLTDAGIFKSPGPNVVRIIPKDSLSFVERVDFLNIGKRLYPEAATSTEKASLAPTQEAVDQIYKRAFEDGFSSGRSEGLRKSSEDVGAAITTACEIYKALESLRTQVSKDVEELASGLAAALALSLPVSGHVLRDRIYAAMSVLSGDRPTLEVDEATLNALREVAPEILTKVDILESTNQGCRLLAGKGWVELGLEGRLALVIQAIELAEED